MQVKPSALMISGSGRSGTTILSLLLSQGDGVLNIGQLRDIWAGWAADLGCSCGNALRSCPLWGAVRSNAFPEMDADAFKARNVAMRAFMQDAARREDWSDAAALAELVERHAGFIDDLARLLHALLAHSGARLLVDSSKSPEFALALHLTGVLDLFILNMVRDPRAVACSWQRHGKVNVTRMMRAWLERQKRLAKWPEAPGHRHRSLRGFRCFARVYSDGDTALGRRGVATRDLRQSRYGPHHLVRAASFPALERGGAGGEA